MSDMDNGGQQPNVGGDKTPGEMDTDLDLAQLDQETDVEKLRGQLKTTVAQKAHWRDKHNKLAEDPRLKAPAPQAEAPKPAPKKGDVDPEAIRSELMDEFRTQQKHPDMTEEEMEKARSLAKHEGKKFSEVVADPYFQAYMATNRAKAAAENARPDPSSRGGSSSTYTVADLNDPVKVKEMSGAEYADLIKQSQKKS